MNSWRFSTEDKAKYAVMLCNLCFNTQAVEAEFELIMGVNHLEVARKTRFIMYITGSPEAFCDCSPYQRISYQ